MQKICTLFAIALFLPLYSLAQTDFSASEFVNYQPELVFEPNNPNPGQEVRVEIGNLVSSLQGSEITWYIDGQIQENLTGRTFILFNAKSIDQSTSITTVLNTPSGQTVEVTGSVIPRYLDIIIEPQTHIPEFYTGRALPSVGSQINATALIDGQKNDNFIYSWRINGDLLDGASLRGGYTKNFSMPMDSRVVLSLDVSDLSGRPFASKSVLLPNTTPFVEFYEVSSLYGLNPNTLNSIILTGNSTKIRAVPFYYDIREYNNPDVVTWKIDNTEITTGNNPYEITLLRRQRALRSVLSFRLQSTNLLLQRALEEIMINY